MWLVPTTKKALNFACNDTDDGATLMVDDVLLVSRSRRTIQTRTTTTSSSSSSWTLTLVGCIILAAVQRHETCCHGFRPTRITQQGLSTKSLQPVINRNANDRQYDRPRFFPGFVPNGPLFASSGDNASDAGDENGGGGDRDLESDRKKLESLLRQSTGDSDGDGTSEMAGTSSRNDRERLLSFPYSEWKSELVRALRREPPYLTSIGRERLDAEIKLLESLSDSDAAIPELWDLWYNARGPAAAKELMQTENMVAGAALAQQGQMPETAQKYFEKAEAALKNLIVREGIQNWVEPINRLATLLYLQQRYQESKYLCEVVLYMKPWHFGALSGIVMVCQRMKDNETMMTWARKRMPPLPRSKEEEYKQEQEALKLSLMIGKEGARQVIHTRQTWVYEMVDQAKANYLRKEMELEEIFQNTKQQQIKPPAVESQQRQQQQQQRDMAMTDAAGRNNENNVSSVTTDGTIDQDDDDAWQ